MTERKVPPGVLRGRQKKAVYRKQNLAFYQGIPTIEALNPVYDEDTIISKLEVRRTDLEQIDLKSLSPKERLHLVVEGEKFYQPLDDQLDIEERLSIMLRQGLTGRNPLGWGFWKFTLEKIEQLKRNLKLGEYRDEVTDIAGEEVWASDDEECSIENGESDLEKARRRFLSSASGYAILGFPGMGKTMAVEQTLLEMYDQVIYHSQYAGEPFPHVQLVWLKIECPSNGSVKSLCIHFFRAVDSILNTNYYERHAKNGHASAEEMMPMMALVAATHSLGLLVLDEIQNLAAVSSGGAERLLNFIVELVNTVGVPTVLVGTNQAYHKGIFSMFRMIRRASGMGDKVWEPMRFAAKGSDPTKPDGPIDGTWATFTEALWRLQFLTEKVELSHSMSKALHDASQGITFFAVKIFFLAQIRAIQVAGATIGSSQQGEPPTEKLTEELIASVLDQFRLASPMLDGIRNGFQGDLKEPTDIKRFDLGKEAERAAKRLQNERARNSTSNKSRSQEVATTAIDQGSIRQEDTPQSTKAAAPQVQGSLDAQSDEAFSTSRGRPQQKRSRAANKQTTDTTPVAAKGKRSPKPTTDTKGKGELTRVVAAGKEQGLSGHAALVEAGLIHSLDAVPGSSV
jgi:hypothetical protein